jgi:hypothetical protein
MDDKNKNASSGSSSEDPPVRVKIVPGGYLGPPAKMIIEVLNKGPKAVGVDIRQVNFTAPEFDLSYVYELLTVLQDTIIDVQEKMFKKNDVEELSRHIGNELVGESYHRWDSRVQYYPTLVFIFLEDEEGFVNRRTESDLILQKKSQIKVRLTKFETTSINEMNISNIITDLQERIKRMQSVKYQSGNVRCTYVNKGLVKWKTSVFCKKRTEANQILKNICYVIGEQYDQNQLKVLMRARICCGAVWLNTANLCEYFCGGCCKKKTCVQYATD